MNRSGPALPLILTFSPAAMAAEEKGKLCLGQVSEPAKGLAVAGSSQPAHESIWVRGSTRRRAKTLAGTFRGSSLTGCYGGFGNPPYGRLVCACRRMNRSGPALPLILTFSPAAENAAEAKENMRLKLL
jgi:hypothetical protein